MGNGPVATRTVVLRRRRDADGLRVLEAERRPDGQIVIEGQDLGPGVERYWGAGLTEYEWTWSIPPEVEADAVRALGGPDGADLLDALEAWGRANPDLDPGTHLAQAGVAVRFWSRVGD